MKAMRGSLFLILLAILGVILSTPVQGEYDVYTFNDDTFSLASLNFTSDLIDNEFSRTLNAGEEFTFEISLSFDMPSEILELEKDLQSKDSSDMEYWFILDLTQILFDGNLSINVDGLWNYQVINWNSFSYNTVYTLSSLSSQSLKTDPIDEIRLQDNIISLNFSIINFDDSPADVSFNINLNSSTITASRALGVAGVINILLTVFLVILLILIVPLPLWILIEIKMDNEFEDTYIRDTFAIRTLNNIDRKLTGVFHLIFRQKSIEQTICPGCRTINESEYCSNCGINFRGTFVSFYQKYGFNKIKLYLPYIVSLIALIALLRIPNFGFVFFIFSMIFAIIMTGQTMMYSRPTFESEISNILIFKKKENIKRRSLSLILLLISIVSYIRVFIPTFIISYLIFMVTMKIYSWHTLKLSTKKSHELIEHHKIKIKSKNESILKYQKGGRLRKGFMKISGKSESRLTRQKHEHQEDLSIKEQEVGNMEDHFDRELSSVLDLKQSYVYASVGLSWFTASIFFVTVGNAIRKYLNSNNISYDFPLSRLAFIDSIPFFIIQTILFVWMFLYAITKDPTKNQVYFESYPGANIEPGIYKTKISCYNCDKLLVNKRIGGKQTEFDLLIKYAQMCPNCESWIGVECALGDRCLYCHGFCTNCGTKVEATSTSCMKCENPYQNTKPYNFCQKCGHNVVQTNYCGSCGLSASINDQSDNS
ncbi:MAG: hypothetical protein HeimC2_27620 [Candidatus Heimdallarchaeota archaeon LC_2]|nr:MAG: hypothetical protein HeimC2_27620 [Candidatus Heimdallarchaeota archaeon LC_2]